MERPRWRREAGVAVVGALAGGLFGAAFDQLVAWVSPEYFLLGKGVAGSALPWHLAVAIVGFRGGVGPGALVAVVGVALARRRGDFEPFAWLRRLPAPFLITVAACAVLAVLADPVGLRAWAAGWWTAGVVDRFLIAWGLVTGAYAGVALAVLVTTRARTWRRSPRAWALPRVVVGALVAITLLGVVASGCRVERDLRRDALLAIAQRSRPLVAALAAYERDHGAPPSRLEALVQTGYLHGVPRPSDDRAPGYELLTGPAASLYRNSWLLVVGGGWPVTFFDSYVYFPNGRCPQSGFGGWLEPIQGCRAASPVDRLAGGGWAYAHE